MGTELASRCSGCTDGAMPAALQHLHIKRSLDLAAGSRETPRETGIAQKWDGFKLQLKGCATSKGSGTIRSAFTDLPHHGGQLGGEGHL